MKLFALSLFVAGALLFAPMTTLATDGSGLGITPAFPRPDNSRSGSIFVHTLSPGSVQEEGVEVANNSDTERTIVLNATDSLVSSGGAFACEQNADLRDEVGSWIRLERSELVLAPGERTVVPFTVTVPKNAEAGEHNGCITLQAQHDNQQQQQGVTLSFRSAIRVAITIPGTIVRSLDVNTFDVFRNDNGQLVHVGLLNNGNVSIDTTVEVTTTDLFGTTVATNGGDYPILRDTVSDINFDAVESYFGGFYKATATVTYDGGKGATVGVDSGAALTTITTEPLWYFALPSRTGLIIEIVVILVLIPLIAASIGSLRRRRHARNTWKTHTVRSTDSLGSIAEKSSASARMIARVNRIRSPYTLVAGEKILVPPDAQLRSRSKKSSSSKSTSRTSSTARSSKKSSSSKRRTTTKKKSSPKK